MDPIELTEAEKALAEAKAKAEADAAAREPVPPVITDPSYRTEEAVDPKRTEKEQLLSKIQIILSDHNNMESNIANNHEYWNLCGRYRAIP